MVYSKINYIKRDNLIIYPPTPCPVDKIQNKYRWQMILKCKLNSKILDIVNYGITIDQKNVSIYVDIKS